jgi:uncharacterized protein (DUF2267 family)/CBS domain-containing protein
MAASGLDVFDKTLQTTNIWLDEIMEEIGPGRQLAWHTLSAVLRTLRDRLTIDLAAHLGAQLPLLIRGVYYEQWHPAGQPTRAGTLDAFLALVGDKLVGARPVDVRDATRAVFRVLSRHVTGGQIAKIKDALPEKIREFWPADSASPVAGAVADGPGRSESGGRSANGGPAMKVSERMSRNVCLAHPGDSIREVAHKMAEIDSGVLPVTDGDRLIGMVTDRDIAIRAVAQGRGPDTKVSEVMTKEVRYCYEDEEVDHVAQNMGQIQVHRLPVVSRDKRLVGIISLGDLAHAESSGAAAHALSGVSRKGGQHQQSAH